jgi:hypothetical protein
MSINSSQNTNLRSVVDALSTERLAPYITHVPNGEVEKALALYQWNIGVSGAFHEAISVAEVCLRNTLHDQLTQFTNGLPGSWFDNTSNLLTSDAREDISKAKHRVLRKGGPITPGRLVSELSFGFWKFLLAKRYETSLWTPALRHGFPQLESQQRKVVFETVSDLNILRNRIAHHEPIFKRDLLQDYLKIYRLINWISVDTRKWSTSFSRIQNCLSLYPGSELST